MLSSSPPSMRRWPLFAMASTLVVIVTMLFALSVLLIGHEPALAQSGAPTVTDVMVSSDAGSDDTYLLGETIQVMLTFSEAVDVTGYAASEDRHGSLPTGVRSGRATRAAAARPASPSLTLLRNRTTPRRASPSWRTALELNGGTIKFDVVCTPTPTCRTQDWITTPATGWTGSGRRLLQPLPPRQNPRLLPHPNRW